jgi:soluble lytic murein transglycosylase-like protein
MSIATVGARIKQIDQLMASVGAGAAPASSTDFSQVLRSAAAAPAPAAAAAGATGGSVPYAAEIDAAAARNGIDPALLKGLIRQESGFNAAARSSAGAAGLTQLMPGTAASLGADPTNPAQAIDGGARYLRQQLDRFGGDASKALAAYNAGPGAVAKFGGVPPYAETQAYVQKVLGYADQYRGTVAAAGSTVVPAVPASTTPVPRAALPYSTI